MDKINVLIVDPHDFFRNTLIDFLTDSPISHKLEIKGAISDNEEMLKFLNSDEINLVLIDITIPVGKIFHNFRNKIKIIGYTMYDIADKSNFLVHKIVRKDEIFEKLADEIENIFMEKEEVK